MIRLNFKINKIYLAFHTLCCVDNNNFSSKKYKKDLIDFYKKAKILKEQLYNLINFEILFKKLKVDYFKKNLEELIKIKEFEKIFQQTKNYLENSKKEWQRNLKKTTKIMSELTGLNFKRENKVFHVYLTHPSLKNGRSFVKLKTITFGHNNDWPNYFTIYMWHEILHFYFKPNDLDHALIELLADNELRIRLNGGKYPPFEGHNFLNDLKKKILPYWKEYLLKENKNIFKFKEKIRGSF